MGEDYIDQLVSSGRGTTMDDIVKMTTGEPRFWDAANYDTTIKDGTVLQPQYDVSGSGENSQTGPVTGVLRYKEGQTAPGQTYEILDPVTGKVTGAGAFKKPGNAWDLLKESAADLGPILSFTPLAPFVRAIGALSAAEQGNVLGALASGLPLADKIPGLDKATVTALQSAGKYASVAQAAKNKDPMELLNALSQTPEFGGKVPQELKTATEYASKAALLKKAAEGDIGAIMKLVPGATKGPTAGQAASAGYGGADPGYFDPDAETSPLPDWMLDPYKKDTQFLPASEVIRERQSLEDRFPPSEDALNLEDFLPGTGLSTQTDQSFDIIGKREKDIPDWDILPDVVTTPRSIRDVGPVTQIQPGEKLEGTDITEPDLAKDLPKVVGGTKTTTKKSGKPKTQDGLDYQKLMAILALMQQKPKEEEEMQAGANIPEGEDLMYGLKWRYA